MKTTGKIQLTDEKETLFITLRAKALDSRAKHSILNDKTAEDLIKRVDYDFSKFDRSNNNITVIRAKQIDEWVMDFLNTNTHGVILYLGCGLDTRISRIDPPPSVSWFDVDYPEVIDLRRNFYSDRNGYQMIASSVNEENWLQKIPDDRPTLIIAEGLLEYLAPGEVQVLFNRLTSHFHQGEIIFDVMNSFAVKAGEKELKTVTGAVHKWAVDDIAEVDKLDIKLKRIAELPLFKSSYTQNLPIGYRLIFSVVACIPRYRDMIKLLRYQIK